MASKRAQRRKLCTNKVSFVNIDIARRVVARYRAKDGDTFVEAFKCHFGGNHYHIGHNKQQRANYVKAARNTA